MKKLPVGDFAAFIGGLALVWTQPSGAWLAQKPAAAAGYTGPGDVQTTKWYYALRALSSATRGNKLVNVCTTIVAVDTCADMSSDATTGALVITTIGAAPCNTSTQVYNIKTWYELNGTGADQVQGTVANRATLTTCTGSTTGAAFSGTVNYVTAGNVTQAQPFEIVWAAQRTGIFTTQANVFEGGPQDGYYTSTNTAYGYTGSIISFTASDAACHTIQIIHNGASGSYQVDGAAPTTSQNFGAGAISATQISLAGALTGRNPTMTFFEGGFVASGSPASLYSNIHAYGNC